MEGSISSGPGKSFNMAYVNKLPDERLPRLSRFSSEKLKHKKMH